MAGKVTDEMVEAATHAFDTEYAFVDLDRLRAALEAVAPLIAEAEREACAKVAETSGCRIQNVADAARNLDLVVAGQLIAAAIRSRSTPE